MGKHQWYKLSEQKKIQNNTLFDSNGVGNVCIGCIGKIQEGYT